MSDRFDPYHRWLGIAPKHQPADHYRLLGIDRFEADPEVIADAAERQIAHVRRYQLGPHSELSQRLLNELATAKGCLLIPAKKAEYDRKLREREVGEEQPVPQPAPPSAGPLRPIIVPSPPRSASATGGDKAAAPKLVLHDRSRPVKRGWLPKKTRPQVPPVAVLRAAVVGGMMLGLVVVLVWSLRPNSDARGVAAAKPDVKLESAPAKTEAPAAKAKPDEMAKTGDSFQAASKPADAPAAPAAESGKEPGFTPAIPLRASAAVNAERPPQPPPKPPKPPFAKWKETAIAIQPPVPSATGMLGLAGGAPHEQPMGTILLDQPQQLTLELVGDVLDGDRSFVVSTGEPGPDGQWQWPVECKAPGVNSSVGEFLLRKKPTAEDPNCWELWYRWTSNRLEDQQLVNCLLDLKVASEGEAEGASRELPLRLAPDPETRPFELWPDAPGTRYLLAVVPVSQLPKTGTVKLTLSIDGFAKPIEHQFTLDHAVSRRTDVAAPAKQPFLAYPFAHVGVRAMAEIDDRQSAIRVWIDLLPWNGDAAVESRPISREMFNEFCQSPRREIRLIEESLPTLKRLIDDQQTAVNKLSKQLRDQQEFVDAAIEAAGRRKLLKGKENAKKLPAEEKAEEKLKEIAGYLRNAEVEKGRLDGELAARENLKAEYQNLAEKVKKCVEMLASLRLKAIAMASIPRKSGSDAETYDVPLATVNFTPP